MIDGSFEVSAGDERVWLLPQLAAYWPRRRALLIADAHLGKAAAFRKGGVAVPAGTTADNLLRLSAVVRSVDAQTIIFLGDLLHSAIARSVSTHAFVRWRAQHSHLRLVLVRGNHERRAGDPPPEWQVDCVDDPHCLEGIALCHLPRPVSGSFAIGGHTHPAARLVGPAREQLRLPCFLFGPQYAILPAFGSFTGMADVEPGPGDRVYVVAGNQVMPVSGE
jgi:DNA ligase-associated metallophosphoesterase